MLGVSALAWAASAEANVPPAALAPVVCTAAAVLAAAEPDAFDEAAAEGVEQLLLQRQNRLDTADRRINAHTHEHRQPGRQLEHWLGALEFAVASAPYCLHFCFRDPRGGQPCL